MLILPQFAENFLVLKTFIIFLNYVEVYLLYQLFNRSKNLLYLILYFYYKKYYNLQKLLCTKPYLLSFRGIIYSLDFA